MRVSIHEIRAAGQAIGAYLPPTPLVRSASLSERLGCELYLKLETMQPIGSFKIRGASYKIESLPVEARKRGVIAASAGNHAQGVAWGARRLGIPAVIVMPRTASLIKIQNTQALGAEVVLEGETFDDLKAVTERLQAERGLTLVHAFEDPLVIAGQGTVGLEILDALPDPDFVFASIGGGGLVAGLGTALRALAPRAWLVGCQSTGADAMARALRENRPVRLESVATFADGTAVQGASPGMLGLLFPVVDETISCEDEAIASAVLSLLERAKVLAEGAGAIPLAAAEGMGERIRGKKVVLVVSGGNIDVNLLARIIDRGLVRAGRRLRVNALISDKPGSLSRLTEVIAREGANIIQVIHDRNEPSVAIDQTEVALTLETRGAEHSEQLIAALGSHVVRVLETHLAGNPV